MGWNVLGYVGVDGNVVQSGFGMWQVQCMDGIVYVLQDVLVLEVIGFGEDYCEFFVVIVCYGFIGVVDGVLQCLCYLV